MKINSCNSPSRSRCTLQRLPDPSKPGHGLAEGISVAHVKPRPYKGIADQLLPQDPLYYMLKAPNPLSRPNSRNCMQLTSRLRSRSLTELTRHITPPIKNDHAPQPIQSRRCGPNCPSSLCMGLVSFPVLSKHVADPMSWWCPSVNSFKLQP